MTPTPIIAERTFFDSVNITTVSTENAVTITLHVDNLTHDPLGKLHDLSTSLHIMVNETNEAADHIRQIITDTNRLLQQGNYNDDDDDDDDYDDRLSA